MATRFRLPSSGTPGQSPALRIAWTHVPGTVVRRPMSITAAGTAFAATAYAPDAADHLVAGTAHVAQFISEPLAAQTIGVQTVSLTMLASEDNAANNLFLQWTVYAVTAADALVGTLVASRADGLELSATQQARTDGATSTSVTVASGNRLVLEIGFGGTPTAAGGTQGHNGAIRFGDAGTDLAANDTATADGNPWLDFATSTLTYPATSSVAGAQPSGSGTLAAKLLAFRAVAGAQPALLPLAYEAAGYAYNDADATYEAASPGRLTYLTGVVGPITRSLTGANPAAAGTLSTRRLIPRALAGAPPAGTATLVRKLLALRSLVGAQPAGSAALTSKGAPYRRALAGAPLAASGATTAHVLAVRAVVGAQDPAAGQLTPRGAFKRTLTGAQPSGTAALARILQARRVPVGAQPAGSAALTTKSVIARRLSGTQPVGGTAYQQPQVTYEQARVVYDDPPGRLSYRTLFVRRLTGIQPGAHGGVGHDHRVDTGLFVYTPHESSPAVIYLGSTVPDTDILAPREDADELVYIAREERTPAARTTYRTRERTTASTYRPG